MLYSTIPEPDRECKVYLTCVCVCVCASWLVCRLDHDWYADYHFAAVPCSGYAFCEKIYQKHITTLACSVTVLLTSLETVGIAVSIRTAIGTITEAMSISSTLSIWRTLLLVRDVFFN